MNTIKPVETQKQPPPLETVEQLRQAARDAASMHAQLEQAALSCPIMACTELAREIANLARASQKLESSFQGLANKVLRRLEPVPQATRRGGAE